MDALSDLLRTLRLSGGVFLDAHFRQPWCATSQVTEEDCAPGTPVSGGLIAFHYVLDGKVAVRVEAQELRECRAGDLIVLSRNDPHVVGSDLTLPPLHAESLIRKASAFDLAQIDLGEGELVSHFVCGYLATAVTGHLLLASLPSLLVASMRDRPCAEWVESSFRYAAHAWATRQAGMQEMLARLSELLFVEALREHIEQLPPEATGWFAALRDPALARALASIHARVAHPWTTEALADEALLSRSAFAERFVRMLGMPPITYLTRWRMLLACQRLRDTAVAIGRIAADVGYDSESTFTRAFTREIGMPPGAYRRTRP